MASNDNERRVRVSLSPGAFAYWKTLDDDRTSVFRGLIDVGLAVEEAGLSGPLLSKAIDTGSLSLLSLLLAPRINQELKLVALNGLLAMADIDSSILSAAGLSANSPLVVVGSDLGEETSNQEEPELEEMQVISESGLGNF